MWNVSIAIVTCVQLIATIYTCMYALIVRIVSHGLIYDLLGVEATKQEIDHYKT